MRSRIRRARPHDARAVARVHAHSWQDAYQGLLPTEYLDSLTPADLAHVWRRRLRDGSPHVEVRVATLEETVVGFCVAHPCRDPEEFGGWAGEVSYLYVHPRLTGRGIGSGLLQQSLAGLERRGCRWVVVNVLEGNTQARRFYEARGLRFDGARWRDGRFGVPVVQHGGALNPVVDFDALRTEVAR